MYNKRGFTLIELLIYTSILVVVLAFTGEYLYSIGQARLNNNARIEVAQNGQLIMNKLKSDLSQTLLITTPSDSNPTGNLVVVLTGDHDVSYSLNGGNIIRNYDAQSYNLNSNQTQISNLSFQKTTNVGGKETIQIIFRITSVAQLSGGRNVSEEFQTTVSRR